MSGLAYNVYCRIADPAHAAAWEKWMREKHIGDVIKAGAEDASLIKIEEDGPDSFYEARYIFASRAAYETYLAAHAPRLRAEGAALFPPGEDFIYSRATATILVHTV